MLVILAVLLAAQAVAPGEQPVDPYVQSNANAGATPFAGQAMWRAFHGSAGVHRIVETTIDASVADPRITAIFRNQDLVRLKRTLNEQLCYILGGGCTYTGRTMLEAHRDMGIQTADMGALVEHLQAGMHAEHVSTFAQNRLLAKLAPMYRTILQRRQPRRPRQ